MMWLRCTDYNGRRTDADCGNATAHEQFFVESEDG